MLTNQLDQYVCFNFYTGWRSIQRFYKDALGKEFSAQQSYVLELCELDKGISISQISKEMKLDKSAVSTLVARMEGNDLVRRVYDLSDRRAVDVRLTNNGKNNRDIIRQKMVILDKKLFSKLTKQEIDTLRKIVNKISDMEGDDEY